ncbi:hypothetical protein [Nocardiopsis lucentensis]|uniref:hypothetical protein n=1 Tax=Nocardiopsis lucentensis TaxID=53441 RepID=UPI00036A7531|nr:hypothetical protein [Nocardiopsis lucentensis]
MDSQDRLKAVGAALVAHRTSLDPTRYRTRPGWMERVAEVADLSRRVIIDIETGARDTYQDKTLTALERVYELRRGTLRDALRGGPLVAADGSTLWGAEEDPGPPPPPNDVDRFATEERYHRMTGRAQKIVRDLMADTEGIPDDVAEAMIQRAMDNAEAQARLMLDSERRRWERQRGSG